MDYRSARDTAEQWGISERLVQRLCAEGRIAGARKISGSWAIPLDAQKPDDMRKRLTREKIVAEILAQASGAEQAHGVDDEAPTAADTPASDTTAAGAPSPDRTSDDANVFANLMPLMNSPFKSRGKACSGGTPDGRLRRWSLRIISVAKKAAVPWKYSRRNIWG